MDRGLLYMNRMVEGGMCHGTSRTLVALRLPNSSLDPDSKEMGMASMVSWTMPPAQPERLTPEVRSHHTSAFHIERS